MTVLVTGATGTIGQHLVRELTAAGVPVRAAVRDPGRATALAGTAAEIVVADLDDARAVDRAVDGADRVVLIAANTDRQLEQESGVIDAAERHGVAHLIKVSVGGAAPEAPLALARDHYEAEVRLRESGTPATIVRPGFLMQNLIQYAGWIGPDGTWPLPLGDAAMAMIDARDVAAGLAGLAGRAPRPWEDLAWPGPEALTMAGAARALGAAAGRSLHYVDGDAEEFYDRLVAAGHEPRYARDLTTLYDVVVRAGWVAATAPDLGGILGRDPRTFAQFAADHAADFRA